MSASARTTAIAIALMSLALPAQDAESKPEVGKTWQQLAAEDSKSLAARLREPLAALADEQGRVAMGRVPMGRLVKVLRSTGFGAGAEGSRAVAADIELLTSLDPEQSGTVALDKLPAIVESAFAAAMESRSSLDTDGDGILTKKEYAVGQVPKFGEFDEHGLDGHGRGHFRREDRDEDGTISLAGEAFVRVQARVHGQVERLMLCVHLANGLDGQATIDRDAFAKFFAQKPETADGLWTKTAREATTLPTNELSQAIARLRGDDRTALCEAVFGKAPTAEGDAGK